MASHATEPRAQNEIRHLLDFISGSSCVFIRNGDRYPAVEARAHIERKHQHIGDRVRTAEDFIAYAATKSSISGEPYLVRCGERELPSAAWLKEELARYRGKGVASRNP
jgi:hypothetical protein